jgi:hypothetical protein
MTLQVPVNQNPVFLICSDDDVALSGAYYYYPEWPAPRDYYPDIFRPICEGDNPTQPLADPTCASGTYFPIGWQFIPATPNIRSCEHCTVEMYVVCAQLP